MYCKKYTFFLMLMSVLFIINGCAPSASTSDKKSNPELKQVKILVENNKIEEAESKLLEVISKGDDLSDVGELYYKIALYYEKNGNIVKARDIYSTILNNYQNIENILEVQEKIGDLNIKILFSSIITDRDTRYEIEPGDNLSKIAKKFKTTVDLIKRSNSLKNDIIRPYSKLKISKAKYKIFVDKSQNILTLFSDDDIFKVYKVSTGRNSCTPVGTFTITEKIKDPPWHTDGKVIPPENPENILGSRWMGLSEEGYGIHGTTEPDTVGQHVTSGCVRMLNEEVEELFTIVRRGTEVTIVD